MWQIILRFGFLAAAILLLVIVGEYALFLKPRAYSWIVGGSAAVLLAAGFWLGRQLVGRRSRDGGPPEPAAPAADAALLGAAGPPNEAAPPPPEERMSEFGVSPREYEVLQLVADGLSNQEIAERLYISESTVKSHVSSLLAKLEAKRRTHAVRRARHLGLIGEPVVRK